MVLELEDRDRCVMKRRRFTPPRILLFNGVYRCQIQCTYLHKQEPLSSDAVGMRAGILLVAMISVPLAAANHVPGCIPTSAATADITVISYGDVVVGGVKVQGHKFYLEDRNSVVFVPG